MIQITAQMRVLVAIEPVDGPSCRAPIQMSDALSRNSPKGVGIEPLQANCLAHGRRQVVEVADNFPEECRYVLETLRDVYHHEALAREQAM